MKLNKNKEDLIQVAVYKEDWKLLSNYKIDGDYRSLAEVIKDLINTSFVKTKEEKGRSLFPHRAKSKSYTTFFHKKRSALTSCKRGRK